MQQDHPPDSAPWARWIGPVSIAIVLVIAATLLHRELSQFHLRDVFRQARQLTNSSIASAIVLTACSYFVLGFYDVLALRYLAKAVPYLRAWSVGFIASAFGHSLSFAALTSGAIRLRLYSQVGLNAVDVATISGFCSLTTGLGLATLAGVSLLADPSQAATALHTHRGWALVVGAIALALLALYLVWAARPISNVELRGWKLRPPGLSMGLAQWALGALDLSLSAAVLWVLLPEQADVSLVTFVGAYAVAVLAGLVSQVPGGLGVFETVIVLSLPHVPADTLLGSLLVYRAIYYVLPLVIAAALFAAREVQEQKPRLARVGNVAAMYVTPVASWIASGLAFIAGCILLLSGAVPAVDARLQDLRHILPLSVLELSHLVGSCIGVGLLILARGLSLRLNEAYRATIVLLVAGAIASFLKGLDFEEAIALLLVVAFLRIGRGAFYRRSSLLEDRFTPGWIASILVVFGAVAWIGTLAHRHVEYSSDLWWTFAFHANAPRMLRASLVAALLFAAFLLYSLMRPARPQPQLPSAQDIHDARTAIAQSDQSVCNAVFAADKRLLFSPQRDAFIMYQVQGRSWVVLGDPIGARAQHQELVWSFRELVDLHDGWPVFYEVSGERLPLYVDLGLAPFKLGEEACVPLGNFSLEGGARADLRQSHRRAQRDGATFEVVPIERVQEFLPRVRAISEAWMEDKATTEKGFSVGAFSEEYLSNFPLALVRVNGEPVAFANLWMTGGKQELSVDLMRFNQDAPRGAMDYLFAELMLWGREQGYERFNLGMAPLSGLERHPLAPAWHRIGNFIFMYGEHFYNFEGLRRFKLKFSPQWIPRYLVAPGGFALPRILMDVSVLISGGVRAVFSK